MKTFCDDLFFYCLIFTPFLSFALSRVSSVDFYNLMGFFAQVLLFILLAERVISREQIQVPIYIYPLVLMGIYVFIWGFYNGEATDRGLFMHLFNNTPIKIASLLIVIENHNFKDRFVVKVLFLLKITVILAAAATLIQLAYDPYFLTNSDFISKIGADFSEVRRKSIFGYCHRLDVGMSFVPIFSIVLACFLIEKGKLKDYLVYLLCAVIVCFGVNSRWIMLNFIGVLSLIVIYSKNKSANVFKYALIVLVLIAIYVGLIDLLGQNYNEIVQNRLASGDNGRLYSLKNFWYFFSQNPIFGRGFHVTDEHSVLLVGVHQIHIGYLAILDHWGIVGSTFQFTFWGMLLVKLYKDSQKSCFWGAGIAFFSFIIANLTLVDYWILHYGLILTLVFNKYYLDASNVK